MIFAQSLETHRATFLESLRTRSYSPATGKAYGQSLGTFFTFLAGRGIEDHPSQGDLAPDVREVTRETIRDYQIWLSSRPYTVWTVCTKLDGLRRFFEHLEATDAILINPCAGLLMPKIGERLPRGVLTQSEARAILNAPDTQTRKGIRDKAILEVFYSTGIRLEEMSRLTLHDVDARQGFLRVNKGKFAKDRVVPMGRKASDYVAEYLKQVRSEWSRENRDERALWLSAIGAHRPVDKQIISVMVRNYGKAALGKSVSAHAWRHTCATHLVANGSNIAYVQRLLGHRSLETTQIYTRVAVTEVKETFRRSHPRARSNATAQAGDEPQRMKGA